MSEITKRTKVQISNKFGLQTDIYCTYIVFEKSLINWSTIQSSDNVDTNLTFSRMQNSIFFPLKGHPLMTSRNSGNLLTPSPSVRLRTSQYHLREDIFEQQPITSISQPYRGSAEFSRTQNKLLFQAFLVKTRNILSMDTQESGFHTTFSVQTPDTFLCYKRLDFGQLSKSRASANRLFRVSEYRTSLVF